MRWILFAGLLACASAQYVTSAQDKVPDPCAAAVNLNDPLNGGCHAVGRACSPPDASVTLLVPSQGSSGLSNLYPGDTEVYITMSELSPVLNFKLAGVGGTCGSAANNAGNAGSVAAVFKVGTTYAITLTNALTDPALELQEGEPQHLCVQTAVGNTWKYSGYKWAVVWSCDVDSQNDDAVKCKSWNTDFENKALYLAERATTSGEKKARLAARSTCCRGSSVVHAAVGGASREVGQCINTKIQSCCGAAAASLTTEKCCNTRKELLVKSNRGLGGEQCPCLCKTQLSCPTGETCCLKRKYSELGIEAVNPDGECYDPKTHRCCDTGKMYDPGSQQCCSVTGVQTLANGQCPCSDNAHCQGGQIGTDGKATQATGQVCCKQTAPPLYEAEWCNAYANYPSGSWVAGSPVPMRCNGLCIDPRFQICCNGQSCVREYDRCCNQTCCNKFTKTCTESFLSPEALPAWQSPMGHGVRASTHITTLAGGIDGSDMNKLPQLDHVTNSNELYVKYYTCTEIEQLDPIKAYWIFVLPTVLLVATFSCLTIVLVYASKLSSRSYSAIDRAMITFAILIILFSLPTFFSPIYKYGVVLVVVALITVLAAAARLKWLNIVLLILQVVSILYLFDPFHGNAFLNFASNRHAAETNGVADRWIGWPDRQTAGILHSTGAMWNDRINGDRNDQNLKTGYTCFQFYRYFRLDADLQDRTRLENPKVKTFGYCSRGWITALLIFEGFLLIFVVLQFVLSLIALILRFREDKGNDPIEFEVNDK